MMTQRYERRQIDRGLFLLDILVVGIFLLSVGMLVVDAYKAGFYEAAADGTAHASMFWRMVMDTGLLMVSLGYFVTRHFKMSMNRIANPWT